MPPPKSQRLLRDEGNQPMIFPAEPDTTPVYAPGDKIKIKEVKCCNDFVAILQFRVQSQVIVDEKYQYKNEGMVVGVGPGLPNALGGRCSSQLKMGEMVSFYGNPTLTVTPVQGLFAGQKVVIVPERSVICRLPAVPFEIIDGKPDEQEPKAHDEHP